MVSFIMPLTLARNLINTGLCFVCILAPAGYLMYSVDAGNTDDKGTNQNVSSSKQINIAISFPHYGMRCRGLFTV